MKVSPLGNQRHAPGSRRPQDSSYPGPDLGLISQQDPVMGGFCAPEVTRVYVSLLSGLRTGKAVREVGAECEQAVF